MAGTCCGRRAARATVEDTNTGIDDLRESIQSPSGAAGLERDPNCACDPCMCPSDDVPCNARYLGDDTSNRGLQQALDRLVRHARQIQAAQGDACDCADRPRRPRVEETGTPERPPVTSPTPTPTPLESPVRDHVVRRDGAPFVFSIFLFPPEIRNSIYEFYFAEARRLLTVIAAVRVRQDEEGTETRIRRYLRNIPREHRRFVLDHRYQIQRPIQWEASITTVQREMAAITYEAYAGDDELAELPNDPLALLRVSREVGYEAGAIFFQSFRFTHPRNRMGADDWVHQGILAAETFFTDRSDNFRRQFRHIELDLGVEEPLREGPTSDADNRALDRFMMPSPGTGAGNWTNGVDRFGILSNILGQMEFRHLTLNFTGTPPRWWLMGVTDPRNPAPNLSSPLEPWAVDLFNIRPRNRLRLQLHFRYDRKEPVRSRKIDPDTGHRRLLDPDTREPWVEENNSSLYNAIHTISIIRRFLLVNAQGMRNQYTGIRVMLWLYPWTENKRRPVEALVECDDQYLETIGGVRDAIVSRLRDRTFDREGAAPQPHFNYSATEHPPPYVEPMPLPPPPPPQIPERAVGDDEEDEANPSILGP
ncbi:hypothetical protein INS49_005028 [Diaporthe citri]|uniref:uncharacterized protein n=1 Tax=Diaporthe citri TaxID=83186 RepID=UPI001C7EF4D9|nr:uncharacterized protein INS49_005028 [Diaporthe citri]KAG6354057.1 hypothetical protein INS49_005028 [Diaporthe citri]